MRLTTLKTPIWISILLFVGMTLFFVSSFLSRTLLHKPNIDSPLLAQEAPRITELTRCDPVVFAIAANGDVYSGKNLIGSLANPLDLTTTIREVVEARAARLAYAPGMDLCLEVPLPHCYDEQVYIKAAGSPNLKGMVRTVQEAGAEVIIIKDRKQVQARLNLECAGRAKRRRRFGPATNE